jgi:glycosyltransferase involved in cell wall biosynthesis
MIRHLPLAASDAFLNPTPERSAGSRTVGYVGNLIDRVDWRLVKAVASMLPDIEFVFIGYSTTSSGGGRRPHWQEERDEALGLPNVRQIAAVTQDQVPLHYWSFALSWIPYAVDHEFNLASCPTKIMDGLASGRPVLSTNVPECALYPEWIEIADTAAATAAFISETLGQIESPAAKIKSKRQVEFVKMHHTWKARAATVQGWLAPADVARSANVSAG